MSTGTVPVGDPAAVLRRIRARARRRRTTAGLAVTVAVLAAFVASLSVGAQGLGPGDVLAALTGLGTPRTELVVLRLRMPRALTALLVGAALGLAGALFQRVLRNTLASPDVIGVGAGAAVGAVTASIVLGLSATGTSAARCWAPSRRRCSSPSWPAATASAVPASCWSGSGSGRPRWPSSPT
ncbi:iron chelate uptake ABC transporter family permease subunit [Pseudonocardia sp. EV170527-09]|uniref:iron chelate uptake ABC transporter family permease subunit n=1 Tax=Pseudonocardia sp. EV170527-09 TaxID=2603411 RepID=UPI002101E667|nr:iron chelate uptake ABC transporter family permease subunit [Pseudonocardia sp. EV170527-09]